jgi:hypothetical protein
MNTHTVDLPFAIGDWRLAIGYLGCGCAALCPPVVALNRYV